eukprot:8271052-Heterocapsa_arctica.AAC.1
MQIDHHHMDSPRTKSDRNVRHSVVMAFDPDQPHERAGLKFFKRCDIIDTASFLRKMEYMEGKEDNIYKVEGWPGTLREHPIEVHGTIWRASQDWEQSSNNMDSQS